MCLFIYSLNRYKILKDRLRSWKSAQGCKGEHHNAALRGPVPAGLREVPACSELQLCHPVNRRRDIYPGPVRGSLGGMHATTGATAGERPSDGLGVASVQSAASARRTMRLSPRGPDSDPLPFLSLFSAPLPQALNRDRVQREPSRA